MIALGVSLAVIIGVSLGLLGGGGSILAVPIFIFALGIETKAALAMSLLVVGLTAVGGVVQHARAGRVCWRTGLVFGAAAMGGAYAGGRIAAFVPGTLLLLLFGAMMLVTAAAMLRGRKGDVGNSAPEEAPACPASSRPTVGQGAAFGVLVGFATGLVGAGGGFLVVPALVLLGNMSMRRAVATSLLVISMTSSAALAGYLGHVELNWPLALAVAGAALAGSILGTRLVPRIPQATLRRVFGWFVIAMAIFIVARQVGGMLADGSLQALAASGSVVWLLPVAAVAGIVLASVVLSRWRLRPAS